MITNNKFGQWPRLKQFPSLSWDRNWCLSSLSHFIAATWKFKHSWLSGYMDILVYLAILVCIWILKKLKYPIIQLSKRVELSKYPDTNYFEISNYSCYPIIRISEESDIHSSLAKVQIFWEGYKNLSHLSLKRSIFQIFW